jgi:hypothetical protein
VSVAASALNQESIAGSIAKARLATSALPLPGPLPAGNAAMPASKILEESANPTLLAAIWSHWDDRGYWPLYPGGPASLDVTALAYGALRKADPQLSDPRLQTAARFLMDQGGLQAASIDILWLLTAHGLYPTQGQPMIEPADLAPGGKLFGLPYWFRARLASWHLLEHDTGPMLEEVLQPGVPPWPQVNKPGLWQRVLQLLQRLIGSSTANPLLEPPAFAGEFEAPLPVCLQALAFGRDSIPADSASPQPGDRADVLALTMMACGKPSAELIEDLVARQGSDGGWAAYPSADARRAGDPLRTDPTVPDVTGWVLEALRTAQGPASAIERGKQFLIQSQQPDGSWLGRWGVAYVYGTCMALRGFRAAGESDREAHILRGGEWIRSIQNADGGWGESPEAFDRGEFVPASSTVTQTAWALMGLVAGGDVTSQSAEKAVEFLLAAQQPGGLWQDFGLPTVAPPPYFLVRYPSFATSFAVLALDEFRRARARA